MAVRDELRALYKVAEIDGRARGLDEEIKAIPVELETRKKGIESLRALVERQRGVIVAAEQLIASTNRQIADRNENMAKARSKSARAGSTKEADGAEREIEAVRRLIQESEAEKARLEERIATTKAGLQEPETQLANQDSEMTEALQRAEARLAELEAARKTVTIGRDELVKAVDPKTMKLYERIRQKRADAMVPLKGEGCSACRVNVPPPKFVNIFKGTEVYQCFSCSRIVYHPDVVAE